jgi:hypothetical protein
VSTVNYRGGCLCGSVRYEIAGELQQVVHCHCTMCRRHSGAAFLTYAACRAEDLRLIGQPLAPYRSSRDAMRGHCARCGSPVTFTSDSDTATVWLTLGSFDEPERVHPRAHYFVASKLSWLHLDDGLPGWQELPR